MLAWIIRVVFILVFACVSYAVGHAIPRISDYAVWMGLGGAIVALIMVEVERSLKSSVFERLVAPSIGLVLGLVMGQFLYENIATFYNLDARTNDSLRALLPLTLMVIFGYFGLMVGMSRRLGIEVTKPLFSKPPQAPPKVLDTSVIIDGRIADICNTGILEGTLFIPQFVLKELQNIADSADSLRRARGRRGLDIINALQTGSSKTQIQIFEGDVPSVAEVDGKLIEVAKMLGGKILTNDFNLNKVAQIHGVEVLNINDLANAMKPALLPDEKLVVKLIKEGKEPNQGVGYLDDGTMVVVDEGKPYLGREMGVLVTSVLQTAAGRMIFAKIPASELAASSGRGGRR